MPRMRINRNLPKAVAYAPLQYGGIMVPEAYTLQNQIQILYLIRQLRWDHTVANDILVTLDNLQLRTGFVFPILEYTATRADFIGNSFLLEAQRRLGEMESSL